MISGRRQASSLPQVIGSLVPLMYMLRARRDTHSRSRSSGVFSLQIKNYLMVGPRANRANKFPLRHLRLSRADERAISRTFGGKRYSCSSSLRFYTVDIFLRYKAYEKELATTFYSRCVCIIVGPVGSGNRIRNSWIHPQHDTLIKIYHRYYGFGLIDLKV